MATPLTFPPIPERNSLRNASDLYEDELLESKMEGEVWKSLPDEAEKNGGEEDTFSCQHEFLFQKKSKEVEIKDS